VITGEVTPYREAVVGLRLRGPGGQRDCLAVVDTGFTDYLTLGKDLVTSLGLRRDGSVQVTLADDTDREMDAWLVEVEWDGHFRTVTALEAEGGPLVGMSLLYGFQLCINVLDGGEVTIQAAP
jgi:clan AA aspartic protease